MAMTPRAKWMAAQIADAFGLGEYDAMEVFKGSSQTLFDAFFKGNGPARIFVYYQTPYKITESGELVDTGGHKEFQVTDGEKVKLKGKGVYFLRNTNNDKPINPQGTNDNDVLFGEISEHTVTSLNTIIN